MQLFGKEKLIDQLMQQNERLTTENNALLSTVELHDLEMNYMRLKMLRLSKRIAELENERASIAGGAIHPHGAIVVPMFHANQAG